MPVAAPPQASNALKFLPNETFICGEEAYELPAYTQLGASPFLQGLSAVSQAIVAATATGDWKATKGNSEASSSAVGFSEGGDSTPCMQDTAAGTCDVTYAGDDYFDPSVPVTCIIGSPIEDGYDYAGVDWWGDYVVKYYRATLSNCQARFERRPGDLSTSSD